MRCSLCWKSRATSQEADRFANISYLPLKPNVFHLVFTFTLFCVSVLDLGTCAGGLRLLFIFCYCHSFFYLPLITSSNWEDLPSIICSLFSTYNTIIVSFENKAQTILCYQLHVHHPEVVQHLTTSSTNHLSFPLRLRSMFYKLLIMWQIRRNVVWWEATVI